MGQFLVLFFF